MQDIHSISSSGCGGGSLFGAGGGDRRLRHHHHHHQALKCPRCDSLNTKFCYYNNYNLSQPRHFCKNCRRYWTIGGVLRNVPVGGGSRKTKRSKPKPTRERKSPSSQNSSSDSSTLTATTTTPAATSTATPTAPITAAEVFRRFDLPALDQLPPVFNMAADVSSFRQQWIQPTEDLMAEMGSVGLMDLQNTGSNGGVAAEDWRCGADQGLYDVVGAVDQAYWSQTPWNDHDHDYENNYLN